MPPHSTITVISWYMNMIPYKSEHFGQMIFDFFEDIEESSTFDFDGEESVNEDEDKNEEDDLQENSNKAFWDSQEEILLATLRRTSSIESKIRQATKEAIKELNFIGVNCACRNGTLVGSCQRCIQYEICHRLQKAGYSCTICKSKWRGSSEIPAGEHTYMEVVAKATSKNGDVRVIIELNFQAEFLIARPCEEYERLISWLPEVFVGKVESLRTLIKILCCASKKCMKEKKMHMAPWRKQKYMQAKWLGRPDHQFHTKLAEILPMSPEKRPGDRRASMLTFDLLDNLHQSTMIEVV